MQKVQTKLKDLWEKVKGFFLKLNKKLRILLGVCAAVLLVLLIAAALLLNRKEYALLQGGLNATEINTIVQYLNDSGVTDYRIDGDSILVPKGREQQLQVQLALSGYNTTGFSYAYYTDNSGGFSTTDERDRAWLISGQEYLAATIRQLDEVRDATVQIAPGTERIYVLDPSATPATATVTITPASNRPLSDGTVEVIRNIVAYGIEGMEVSNVYIGDTLGNSYSDTSGVGEMSEASALKMQWEQEMDNKLRTQILNNLEPIYGPGNVNVSVTTVVDVSRRVIETTEYEQPDGSVEGGGLIGTDNWFWEVIRGDEDAVGGVVGADSNSDIPGYPDLTPTLDGTETYASGSGDRTHNINTTVEQKEVLAGTITDIGVAVSINQSSPTSGSLTVDTVREHIAVLTNIGSDDPLSRVSVVIAPFYEEMPVPGPIGGIFVNMDPWMLYAAIGGLVLFVILLILVILLARRSKKKKLAKQKALEEEMAAAEAAAEAVAAAAAVVPAPTGGADIMEVNTEKSMELRQLVRQFAQNNPEIAAQMVKSWLRGEDDNG